MRKYAVGIECDLEKGICFLARLNEGHGKVALFDTTKELKAWLDKGEDLDDSVFDISIIKTWVA